MRVYIVRHGKAERDSPTGRDDDRPLKPRGIEQARWLGEALAASKRPPGIVLSSPLARAIDTARAIHARVGCPLEVFDQLSGGHDVAGVIDLVGAHASAKALAVVGHNPQLSLVAAALIDPESGAAAELRTGECYAIDFDDEGVVRIGAGRLRRRLRIDDED